jgi:hypothetical protein
MRWTAGGGVKAQCAPLATNFAIHNSSSQLHLLQRTALIGCAGFEGFRNSSETAGPNAR